MKCSTPVIHKTLLEQHLGQGCFPESLTTGKNSPRKHMNKTNKRSKHITRDVSPTFIHQSISICHHKQLFGSPLENALVLHLKPLVPQPQHSPHTRAAHAHQMAAGVHKPGEGFSPSMSEKGHSPHHALRETPCTTSLPRKRHLPSHSPWSLPSSVTRFREVAFPEGDNPAGDSGAPGGYCAGSSVNHSPQHRLLKGLESRTPEVPHASLVIPCLF